MFIEGSDEIESAIECDINAGSKITIPRLWSRWLTARFEKPAAQFTFLASQDAIQGRTWSRPTASGSECVNAWLFRTRPWTSHQAGPTTCRVFIRDKKNKMKRKLRVNSWVNLWQLYQDMRFLGSKSIPKNVDPDEAPAAPDAGIRADHTSVQFVRRHKAPSNTGPTGHPIWTKESLRVGSRSRACDKLYDKNLRANLFVRFVQSNTVTGFSSQSLGELYIKNICHRINAFELHEVMLNFSFYI